MIMSITTVLAEFTCDDGTKLTHNYISHTTAVVMSGNLFPVMKYSRNQYHLAFSLPF